jgi:hypothetical protein
LAFNLHCKELKGAAGGITMETDKARSRVFIGVIVLAMLLFTLPALQALLASVR